MTYQISGKTHRELPVPAPRNLCVGAAEDMHKQDHHCLYPLNQAKAIWAEHVLKDKRASSEGAQQRAQQAEELTLPLGGSFCGGFQ